MGKQASKIGRTRLAVGFFSDETLFEAVSIGERSFRSSIFFLSLSPGNKWEDFLSLYSVAQMAGRISRSL